MSSSDEQAPVSVGFNQIEAFAQLDEATIAALRDAAELLSVRGGEKLIEFGGEADALYLVVTGRFLVKLPDGRVVAEVEAGEPIGELAFFAGGTRTADIVAARDSTVFSLSREAYDRVSDQHRSITDGILSEIARRLARTTAASASLEPRPGRVVALLPAANAPIPQAFVRHLETALSKYQSQRFVTPDTLPDGLDPESDSFGRWIAELEQQHERIVLCGAEDAAWNRAVARNSDDLVLVAPLYHENSPSSDRTLSELEAYAIPSFLQTSRILVLWRETDVVDTNGVLDIRGTGDWLAHRPVHHHHHIAMDDPAGFERVARFMTGRATGVVLAGGGALGCAHLGVIQAMLDSGIPVDFFGGTSVGSAVAGAVARGTTVADTITQMEEMFVTQKAMRRPTIPVHSLLDPRVFDDNLRMRYGVKDIADIPYNFLAVSTNLSTNSIHVHRRGPLWEAVRASSSLPAILPPFITSDGQVLVDGGVLDNVPVDVMRHAKTGPNVVVTLRPDAGSQWRSSASYESVRGPGQLARDLLLRRKPADQLPNLVEVMSRSMVVASEGRVEGALANADALLVPPIPADMQLLDWHLGKKVAEIAHEFTMEAIATRDDLSAMKAK